MEGLTGALIFSSQQVGPDHGPHPEETDADGYIVDGPVASLQNPPGENHQDRDHEAVQQLETSTSIDISNTGNTRC